MAIYIEMPKLADTMTEGTLVKWRKAIGDKVQSGDVIAEVETDKATMEMESFDDGILHEYLVKEGSKAPVGAKIALLLAKGEQPPAAGSAPAAPAAPAAKPADQQASSSASTTGQSAPAAAPGYGSPSASGVTAVARTSGERVKSSPLARKIAQEKGIDISTVRGSGPGGRIVAADVQAGATITVPSGAPGYGAPGAAGQTTVAALPLATAGAGDQRLPLSGMRRVIADRLLQSKTQIPHFYLHIEIDAGPLMKLRSELNAASEAAGGPKLTVNDFILKGVIAAAVKVPAVNASFTPDAIIQYSGIHLSVAVAVEEGLVTPVIKDAQKKGLREISEAVKDLATRARNKKLKPDEYQGGTITVSNLGAFGIEFFDAIINPPQAIIVSVGAIVKKPVVGPNDQIVAGQRLAIGLSADHRVVDGAIGAQYLAELKRLLESPTMMLL